MTLLQVSAVHKIYGKLTALENVDLTVEPGQFHGLIGPNGSGKTTLLKCIAGAEIADRGTVTFQDIDITTAPPAWRARRGMSLKFQITSVFDGLSVYDNVLLSLQADQTLWQLARSRSRRALHPRVLDVLGQFNLADRADDLAGALSHGEQQWLEIAVAQARNPKLLLLDEPTAGMSPEERRITGELLKPMKARCSLLIVEHDLDFIKDMSDVITVLGQGQVLDHGTPEHIEASERVQEVYVTRV
jgi:branched-chain amino acid transport system ATP-binding protein